MWGSRIVFETSLFVYDSGGEGDICLTGFAAHKPSLVLYMGKALQETSLMSKLGKYTVGRGYLYMKALDELDRNVRRDLIAKTVHIGRRACRD